MQRTQIDYAPTLPGHRRHRAVRRIAVGLITLALVVIAIKGAPSARRRVELLYWQHRALSYSPPPNQVVYDDNPDTARVARPWERFYQALSPPGRLPTATLFLHELRNSRGEKRLVVIEESPAIWAMASGRVERTTFRISQTVIAPGGFLSKPHVISDGRIADADSGLSDNRQHLRWFAGRPDPANRAHFTISGTCDGNPFMFDGWLRDDDRIDIARRDMPSDRPE